MVVFATTTGHELIPAIDSNGMKFDINRNLISWAKGEKGIYYINE